MKNTRFWIFVSVVASTFAALFLIMGYTVYTAPKPKPDTRPVAYHADTGIDYRDPEIAKIAKIIDGLIAENDGLRRQMKTSTRVMNSASDMIDTRDSTIEELRKENTALHHQVNAMRARLESKTP